MLYMGEEWAASTPFLYFVDFSDDEALAAAVREGRRREFANFKSFAEQDGQREIPDPTVEDTFAASRLDWSEPERPPHDRAMAETRALLALRRGEIVPLTKTRFLGARHDEPRPGLLDVTWRFDGGTLRFVANCGPDEARLPGIEGRVIWRSPGAAADEGSAALPSWTGFFIKGERS
jgi:maltooligosyltrehalose trehalohydrolase